MNTVMDFGVKRWKEEEDFKINIRFCNWVCYLCVWLEESFCCLIEDKIGCRREGSFYFFRGDVWLVDR